MKPFVMAGLAEEFGFIVAPRVDSPFGMPRNRTTTRALEMRFFGLAFWQKLANKGQDNNTHDHCADDEFR